MKNKNFILVGFGDIPLLGLVDDLETDMDVAEFLLMAPTMYAPKYKHKDSCSVADYEAAVKYLKWMQETVSTYEETN